MPLPRNEVQVGLEYGKQARSLGGGELTGTTGEHRGTGASCRLSGSSRRVLHALGRNGQDANFKVLPKVGLPCRI